MPNCREIARTIAGDDLSSAGWGKRLAVRLHLLYCRHCRTYRKQIRTVNTISRERWGPVSTDPQTIERLEDAVLDRVLSGSRDDPADETKFPNRGS